MFRQSAELFLKYRESASGKNLVQSSRRGRSTASVAAGVLEKNGMIRYTRGSVTIFQRQALAETTCACDQIIRKQTKIWSAKMK
jgi:hypothetical protein